MYPLLREVRKLKLKFKVIIYNSSEGPLRLRREIETVLYERKGKIKEGTEEDEIK